MYVNRVVNNGVHKVVSLRDPISETLTTLFVKRFKLKQIEQ